MGGEASRPLPPWFATPTTEYPAALSGAIQRLSSTARPFISGEPHYYSEFELEHHMNRLQGALSYDKNIAVWYPKLVPKHVTETEFWRNYFSHVAALVTEAQNNGQLSEVGTAAAVEEYRRGAGLPTDSPLGNGTSSSPATVAASSSSSASTSSSSSPSSFPLSQTIKSQANATPTAATPQFQSKPIALPLSLLPSVTSTSSNLPLRWGVIGCGARAKLVLPILTSLANSSITAIARQSPWKGVEQSAVNCATLFSILGLPAPARGPDASFVTLHTSVDALVNDPQVDAIYVCTPTGTHAHIADVASKSRKACVFDGTLARSAFELSPMLRQFQANSTPLFAAVAGVTCCSEKTRLLQTILSSKRLGDLRAVSVELHLPAIASPWRSNAELNGGGPLMEAAHQTIQMLDALIGPLSLVHGDATHIPVSGAASSALPTENSLSATFRAAGKGSSNAPILCTFSLSATGAMPLDRVSFTGTNARLLTSVFGADSPFISGSPPASVNNAAPTVTTEVRFQRASDGSSSAVEVQVQPFLPATSSISPTLSPADSAAALSNFLMTVAAEIRQWKSNAPPAKESVSLTTMSFGARSTQVLDAILRDFYRDRSDFFWLRPQTWKRS